MTRSWRTAVVLGAALASGVASAASRVVLQLGGPTEAWMDGQRVEASSGRMVVNHVASGTHHLVLKGLDGVVFFKGDLVIPENTEVRGTYTPGVGLVVDGATVSDQTPGRGGPPAEVSTDTNSGTVDAPEEGVVTSFDYNEGGKGGATPSHQSDGPAGNPQALGRTLGTVGRVAGYTVAPLTTSIVTVAAPAAARGVSSTLRNADAGGTSALRGGSTRFKQGRPIPPKADTGVVEFIALENEPYVVYLEGFVIAQLMPGDGKAKAKLEVGRHTIEIWDGDTMTPRYKGVALVEKDLTVRVQFSDAVAPTSPARHWAWSPR